ncbi:hypothetical protein M3J09_010112 [Ascochyta lentis]
MDKANWPPVTSEHNLIREGQEVEIINRLPWRPPSNAEVGDRFGVAPRTISNWWT